MYDEIIYVNKSKTKKKTYLTDKNGTEFIVYLTVAFSNDKKYVVVWWLGSANNRNTQCSSRVRVAFPALAINAFFLFPCCTNLEENRTVLQVD
jgi:hypothetical protein